MLNDYLEELISQIMQVDPAARSRLEVYLCYPGFHAMAIYQISSTLWKQEKTTLARLCSHIGRMLTGIEIHPGATIGRRFIIDHGMGVVIGETAVIGDDCFLYQGVTLGAGAEARGGDSTRGVKRHPTLGNGVIVGSGAEIQGDIIVSDNVRVASGSIVLKDVPANSIVVGVPGRVIYQDGKKVTGKIPDIEAEAIKSLQTKLKKMEAKLDRLDKNLKPASKDDDKSETPKAQDANSVDDSDPVDVFLQGAGI